MLSMHYKLVTYYLVNMYFIGNLFSYYLAVKLKSFGIDVLLYHLRILVFILMFVLQKSFLKLIVRVFRYDSLFKTVEVRCFI